MTKLKHNILSSPCVRRAFGGAALMLAACAMTPSAAHAGVVTVTASIDSTEITMGSRTNMHIEIEKDGHKGTLLNLPKADNDFCGVDVISVKGDSSEAGGNRWKVTYDLVLQPFDPGDVTFEPFLVDIGDGKLVESNVLSIKVLPVDLSPELGNVENVDSLTIHPNSLPLSVKGRWYDFLPSTDIFKSLWFWLIVGAVLLIAVGVTLYVIYRKNGTLIITPRKPPVPPYELAMARLEELRLKRLPERGEDKLYYTELTDILRQYLESRFGINAMEMTTTQIMSHLNQNEDARMSADQMRRVLETADFVKFAKVRPLPDDNIKAFNNARSFVEETRPVAVTPDSPGNGTQPPVPPVPPAK